MSEKVGNWFRKNYRNVIIGALVLVPFLVSIISTIHVVDFFQLSNYYWLAITLAIAFEIGALSSLAALAVMDKISKISLWMIFILITIMQMMGNIYYAFDFITIKMGTNPEWTQNWIDLFSIQGEGLPLTKRILAIVSGGFLPIISLTFLHMLITYITKSKSVIDDEEYEYITVDENGNEIIEDDVISEESVNATFVPVKDDRNPVDVIISTTNQSDGDINVNEGVNDIPKENFRTEIKYNSNEKKTSDMTSDNLRDNNLNTVTENPIPNIKLTNDILPVMSQLIQHIKPDLTEQDIIELKKQLEKNITLGTNGKPQIDLSTFAKFSPSTQSMDNSKTIRFAPDISLVSNQKKDNTDIKKEIILGDQTQLNPVTESMNYTIPIENDIPNNTNVMDVNIPEQQLELVNNNDERLIPQDITLESMENDTNQIASEQVKLDSLNGIEIKKKKILLYKEKQKRIYDDYE